MGAEGFRGTASEADEDSSGAAGGFCTVADTLRVVGDGEEPVALARTVSAGLGPAGRSAADVTADVTDDVTAEAA